VANVGSAIATVEAIVGFTTGPVELSGAVAGLADGSAGMVAKAVGAAAATTAMAGAGADSVAVTAGETAPMPGSRDASEVGTTDEAGSPRGSSTGMGCRCTPTIPWRAGPLRGGTGYPGPPPLVRCAELLFGAPGPPGLEPEVID
jgi:hypothetical protein